MVARSQEDSRTLLMTTGFIILISVYSFVVKKALLYNWKGIKDGLVVEDIVIPWQSIQRIDMSILKGAVFELIVGFDGERMRF